MLEWGITLEIKPKADLLFMLADACCSGGRWEKNLFLNYWYYHVFLKYWDYHVLYHFEESQHLWYFTVLQSTIILLYFSYFYAHFFFIIFLSTLLSYGEALSFTFHLSILFDHLSYSPFILFCRSEHAIELLEQCHFALMTDKNNITRHTNALKDCQMGKVDIQQHRYGILL